MTRLLELPGEIRNMIYKLALIEIPAWERRHSAFCAYRPTHRSDVPILPYALTIQRSRKRLPVCQCTKRQSLGLLGTCCQIHREAGSLFWSGNAFTFKSHRDFVKCISHTSDTTCQHIRNILVLNYLRYPNVITDTLSQGKTNDLWAALFRLPDLRILHMDPSHLDYRGTHAMRIPTQLPRLRALWATTLHARAYHSPRGRVPGLNTVSEDSSSRLPAIHFLCSLSVRWKREQLRADTGSNNVFRAVGFPAFDDTMFCFFIFSTALADWITQLLDIPPATAPLPDPPEPGEFILSRSLFPYNQVSAHMANPHRNFANNDRLFMVDTLGLPAMQDELAEYTRSVDINARLRAERFRQSPEAGIHERMWAPFRRRRQWDLARRSLNLLFLVVLAEMFRPAGIVRDLGLWVHAVVEIAYPQLALYEFDRLIRREFPRWPRYRRAIVANGFIFVTSLISFTFRFVMCFGPGTLLRLFLGGGGPHGRHPGR